MHELDEINAMLSGVMHPTITGGDCAGRNYDRTIVMNKHKPFITVTQGMSGHFAVCMSWNTDGFWEPQQTGLGRFATWEEAAEEGQYWASVEELEFQS